MSRTAFQVLVIPYRINASGQPQYLLFKRFDLGVWQWIAGGGENQETPEQVARREVFEEANISEARLIQLDSAASIPVIHFADRHLWGTDVYVVSEFAFGVDVGDKEILLSKEHSEYVWLDYEEAHNRLKWDSNKTALWELHSRLSAGHDKFLF